jgi:hypothetical protein
MSARSARSGWTSALAPAPSPPRSSTEPRTALPSLHRPDRRYIHHQRYHRLVLIEKQEADTMRADRIKEEMALLQTEVKPHARPRVGPQES